LCLGRSGRRALEATSKECREWILGFAKTLRIRSGIPAERVAGFRAALELAKGVHHLIVGEAGDTGSAALHVTALQALQQCGLGSRFDFVGVSGTQENEVLGILPNVLPCMQQLRVDTAACTSAFAAWHAAPHLRKLVLAKMNGEVHGGFLPPLGSLPLLQELEISDCDVDGPSVADALAQLTSLRSLRVSFVATAEVKALSTLTALTALKWDEDLSWDPEDSSESNVALAALSTLVDLKELSVRGLELSDVGMQGLRAMTQLTQLTALKLAAHVCALGSGIPLSDLEVFVLHPAAATRWLACSKSPPGLSLTYNGYDDYKGDDGFVYFVDISCAGNGCPVSADSVREIADSLQHLVQSFYGGDISLERRGV